jgi:hypothetical protein
VCGRVYDVHLARPFLLFHWRAKFKIAAHVDELVGLRDTVDRLSGISDSVDEMVSVTRRIPFWRTLSSSDRPRPGRKINPENKKNDNK